MPPHLHMKGKTYILMACVTIVVAGMLVKVIAQDTKEPLKQADRAPVIEYASVRFMEEKTSIVWPDGTAENVMAASSKLKLDNGNEKYPKGSDYRMYWLTVAMNMMGKRGFEFVYMNGPDVVMKRQTSR